MSERKPKLYRLAIPSLEPGWNDRDYVLLHASFQTLVDFMEKEKPDETIDWSHDADHRKAWKELQALYKWWTVTRPNRKDPDHEKFSQLLNAVPKKDQLDVIGNKKDHPHNKRLGQLAKKSAERELKWHDEDQKNLHRLVDVRPYMWT